MKTQHSRHHGFTRTEFFVVIGIIIVVAAIAFPSGGPGPRTNKAEALSIVHQLAGQLAAYAADNDGNLPAEDAAGKDGWKKASEPDAESAWYNALPRRLGVRGAGDFAKDNLEAAFYSKENVIFLPGADYPMRQKLEKPMFAIAMNTKLRRPMNAPNGGEQKQPPVKLASISLPDRTVVFLERGLRGEKRAHPAISAKADYDGSPKGSAKSFVTRYAGKGVIAFADGHAELISANEILSAQGNILWDADWQTTNPAGIYWTPDPKEDPN